ncbi:MAG: PQQ-like beta-propeller repeat protein [Marinilabiliaceae bacterium]|nr:PQQ-like beta-propeller repeat protein [Marinilabiliaceae bacterium]
MIKLKIILTLTISIYCLNISAQDWFQWRGENRRNIIRNNSANLDWSEEKPRLAWIFRDAGAGYSSPAVVGTTLYLSGADSCEFAFALDTETGKLIWKQQLGERFVQEHGDGPRGTITVDDDRLYLLRPAGDIHCLSAIDGKILWQRNLPEEFDGKIMSQWGYSESLLIDDNLMICTPGGESGTMAALDKYSGKTVWIAKEWTDEAAYSSPIVAEIEGVRQYIQQSAKGIAGVSAKDGKLLWRLEIEGYKVAVIPTPLYHENLVYATAGYNAGSTAIRLSKENETFKTEIVYANTNMCNYSSGVVLIDGYLYGFSETSGWTCQNLETGENVWHIGRGGSKFGNGGMVAINDRLLLSEGRGALLLIEASPNGWKEFGGFDVPERTTIETNDNLVLTHHVVANGKLYVRDQDLLFCYEL